MNIQEKAKELFNNPNAPASLNEHNQQQYIKAMEYLGEKHILKTFIEKKAK